MKDSFQFLKKFSYDLILFSVKKSFDIQELLHYKSKHPGTRPMHPSSSRAFQRHQEHDLKHTSLVDLITTKQNKLPSFIDRCKSPIDGLTSSIIMIVAYAPLEDY
jgi:hypothetical protein